MRDGTSRGVLDEGAPCPGDGRVVDRAHTVPVTPASPGDGDQPRRAWSMIAPKSTPRSVP